MVECHATLVKAICIGKGTPTFNVTGLTQQSDVASSETYAQWKHWSKQGSKEATEPMDLSQIENLTARNTEVLLFMGQDNLHLRDHETEDDLVYWEDELASKDTTITEMIRAELTTQTRLVITVILWDTSKPNALRDVKDQGNIPPGHLRTEEEEETDQVVLQASRDEELAHQHHGHEGWSVVEGGTSTTVPESPRSPRSRKMTTQRRSKLPKILNRIFRGGRAHQCK